MSNTYVTGTVKWYDSAQGKGVIVTDSSKQEVTVAASAIQGTGRRELTEGDRVQFQVVSGQARNVRSL